MTKDELYRIYVLHAKADFRVAKTAGKDTYYAGMFPSELFAQSVGVDELKPFVKDGTLLIKKVNDGGTIRNVYLWAAEEVGQRSEIKKFLVKTKLYKPLNFITAIIDEGVASIIEFVRRIFFGK